MINIDKVIREAIKRDASDIHLLCGIKPMLRIARDLVPYDEECEDLSQEDMVDIYDYFIKGNVDKIIESYNPLIKIEYLKKRKN